MHCCRFRCQVINHILPVLLHTIGIIERLGIEGESYSIRAVPNIKVLRSYTANDSNRTNLNTIRLGRCQVIAIRSNHG